MELTQQMDLRIKKLCAKLRKNYSELSLQVGECDLCSSNELKQALICEYCLADLPLFNYHPPFPKY